MVKINFIPLTASEVTPLKIQGLMLPVMYALKHIDATNLNNTAIPLANIQDYPNKFNPYNSCKLVCYDDGYVKTDIWDRLRDAYRASWIPLVENRTLDVTFIKNTASSLSSSMIQKVVIKKPPNYRLVKLNGVPQYEVTPFISYKTGASVLEYSYDVSENMDEIVVRFIFEDPDITTEGNYIQASFDIQVLLQEVL